VTRERECVVTPAGGSCIGDGGPPRRSRQSTTTGSVRGDFRSGRCAVGPGADDGGNDGRVARVTSEATFQMASDDCLCEHPVRLKFETGNLPPCRVIIHRCGALPTFQSLTELQPRKRSDPKQPNAQRRCRQVPDSRIPPPKRHKAGADRTTDQNVPENSNAEHPTDLQNGETETVGRGGAMSQVAR
jgi:hypothetical protein